MPKIDPLISNPAETAKSTPPEVQKALFLARELCRRARELQTPQERRQQAELDRMIQSPHDKATLMQLTDQAFRSERPHRAADQLIHILDVQGVPRFFGALDRTLLLGFQSFGSYLPGVAMPFVKDRMQQETANVILPAEREHLAEHLRARRREGVRMNVNYLGEALLGEADARRRLQNYLAALQQPEIEVISVKISTIYSQISPLAREHTVGILCDRLELLFRAAAKAQFKRHDGTVVPKFVYLDMEEYRDKDLTAEVFMRVLDRPGLERAQAGIALQAYIPDSFLTQQHINEWARKRVASGGSPVTIRIVKGANMEAERVEASLRGWPQAPYKTKLETDANYLRMLDEGLRPENITAVRLGIASHNLFTLAYGIVLATNAGVLDRVQFEMLEGMANHQRRAIVEHTGNMLLYAPACRQEDFTNAIGYLVRRLDENSGPDNFLRYAFNISVDSPEWYTLERQFVEAHAAAETVSSAPRRTQNRATPAAPGSAGGSPAWRTNFTTSARLTAPDQTPGRAGGCLSFHNEPETDWSLRKNGDWAQSILAAWQTRHGPRAAEVPLVIAGEELADDRKSRDSVDPSRPDNIVARYRQATEADIDRAVSAARDDADGWRRGTPQDRLETLHRVAEELAAARGELMGAMLAEGGKVLTESDPEVSEAIDFCRFYAESAQFFYDGARANLPLATTRRTDSSVRPSSSSHNDTDGQNCPSYLTLRPRPKGVAVVISPWNFPLAIPCGGVAAALAAGNTVILKPASDTVLIAYLLCQCFWRAGVPKTALQFAPCSGGTVGSHLVAHDGVDVVILTGGTATAAEMLRTKPTMRLFAETGGKNATIVTALADRDQAIKNVLHSAFSHSGQKCSATSLLILEREVYHDAGFRAALCDAVESLHVGSAWELHTKVGPLIRPPSGVLETALKELDAGEEWAVMPRLHVGDNPHLVSPGVKWGVAANSFTHGTELFGPVLGVMEARDLDDAIDLVNATGYGLTSGLESLDDREQQCWASRIRAGNLYINRPTTGAIVLRQPFGGMGKSAVGPGIKAGGPNYVVPLMNHIAQPSGLATHDQSADVDSKPRHSEPERLGYMSFATPPRAQEHLRDLRIALQRTDGEFADVLAALDSYEHWANQEFRVAHDDVRLLGEDNFRRYLPVEPLIIRVHADDTLADIFCRTAAANAAGCRAIISSEPVASATGGAQPAKNEPSAAAAVELLEDLTQSWAGAIEFIEEDDEALADAIRAGRIARIRYAAPDRVPDAIRRAAAESLFYIADTPVSLHGRIELLWYLREQSISHIYHRYGNLGLRASEPRDEPP